MLPITKDLLNQKKCRPALVNPTAFGLRTLKGIVIHWTANPGKGANAKANRNYFNSGVRAASAHYVVDGGKIIQCVPDLEVAYHVGAKSYRPQGQRIMEGRYNPNYFLIGIEMCINVDNDWAQTYQNTLDLTRYLLNKHHLTVKDLYRHYDITGKDCPKMMVDEPLWNQFIRDMKHKGVSLNIPFVSWEQFKADVNNTMEHQMPQIVKNASVNTSELNVRSGPGTQFGIIQKLKQGDIVKVYEKIEHWARIGEDSWVGSLYLIEIPDVRYGEIETSDKANVRNGPGSRFPVLRTLADGANVEILEEYDGWYMIAKGEYVHSSLIKIVQVRSGRVNVPDFLNVRTGPGTNFNRVRQVNNGVLVKVFEEQNKWFRIGNNEWINGLFVELVG